MEYSKGMSSQKRDADEKRLEALRAYHIIGMAHDRSLDSLTEIAALLCGAPAAAITLIDGKRLSFKSQFGLGTYDTTLEGTFCSIAVQKPEILIVNDALTDPRFKDSPYVTCEDGYRFYAGAPLITPAGERVG